MIETSLVRLDEAVQNGQRLSTEMKVKLPLGEDAEIYGFIPIVDDMLSHKIDMPPLGECLVFSNRIIFYFDKVLHRYPIFKSVSKASKEKYNLYLLYVPRFLILSQEWGSKYYQESMYSTKPNPKVSKLEGVKIEENIAYYYPNELDLYFETKSKLSAIESGFLVVTRRISKLSENFKYEVFDSHSVMIEQK